MKKDEQAIDFVVTWVDGNDPAWRAQKKQYMPSAESDDREERYRDWDLLQYWFRGVERFAPWVRTIHFVTWGHLPSWLDTENPKLHIVRHEDIIPAKFLPVFNSNVIELYLHKIPGLSEHFVYFNDDFFVIRDMKPEDFFRNGKPCDLLAFQPVVANPANPVMSHLYLNNILTLSRYFRKRENFRKQPGSYLKPGYPPLYFFYNLLELAFPLYTGLFTPHSASPFCRSTFEEIWEKEEKLLLEVSAHRFRSRDDVTPYLFREWQKLSGNFYPCNVLKQFRYFNVGNENRKLIQTITDQRVKMVCINDANERIDFEQANRRIRQAFEQILPESSSFER